jgi:hypothetical protein
MDLLVLVLEVVNLLVPKCKVADLFVVHGGIRSNFSFVDWKMNSSYSISKRAYLC